MEPLSIGLSSSPNYPKIHKPTVPISSSISSSQSPTSNQLFTNFTKKTKNPIPFHSQLLGTVVTHPSNPFKNNLPVHKIQSLSLLFVGFPFPLSSFASEAATVIPTDQSSNKINLEAIIVSIDDFLNRYPFFAFGVSFIWLFVIPATQEYLRKYKFIYAINAFKKLKEDPNAQMLDIRDKKSRKASGSLNLKLLGKNVVRVEFREGDEEGFVNKVKESFKDPANTTICILDNFDGNSLKVAELLFNNGFKAAYAIRGGVRGEKGWQAIQETLLPPSVRIYPKKKDKRLKQVENNGAINQQGEVKRLPTSDGGSVQKENGYVNMSIEPNTSTKVSLSTSPYPMYQDMKPPSSPTPSKPQGEVKRRQSSEVRSEWMDNGYVSQSIKPNASMNRGFRSLSPYPVYPDMKPPSSPTPSKPQ